MKKETKQKTTKSKQESRSRGKNDKERRGNAKRPKPILSANFPGLVDLVLDPDGNVKYLVKSGEDLSIRKNWIMEGDIFIPPNKKDIPFELVDVGDVLWKYYSRSYLFDEYTETDMSESDEEAEEIHRQLNEVIKKTFEFEEVEKIDLPEKHTKTNNLFEVVSDHFRQACYLTDEQRLIVSNYVLLTYLQDHEGIRYVPFLSFYALPERGKTRTGKAMTYIAYRGTHTVTVRSQHITRFSDYWNGSLFIDSMDFWGAVLKEKSEDIFLLRYEKGAKVPRVLFPERGAFKDTKYFNVFGPTIIATNKPLSNILDTRCFEISILNMPGEYADFSEKDACVKRLKGWLTAWRARVMDKPLPLIEKSKDLDGRLWDIGKPLLKVCKLVCPEKYDALKAALLNQAKQRSDDKKESFEAKIISIIYKLSEEFIWWKSIPTSRVLTELNAILPEKNKISSQGLGRKLRSMGIKTNRSTGYSVIPSNQEELEKLYDQYGCRTGNATDAGQNSENSGNSNIIIISNI